MKRPDDDDGMETKPETRAREEVAKQLEEAARERREELAEQQRREQAERRRRDSDD